MNSEIKNNIEVLCIYYSHEGRTANYYDISQGLNSIDERDMDPDGFWCSSGGFSITLDGYKTIFSACSFYNIVKATTFLIGANYWLKGMKSEWSDFEVEDNEVSVTFGYQEVFSIKKGSENDLLLSYCSSVGRQAMIRGDRSFDNIRVLKEHWIEAVNTALKEYFDQLIKSVNADPERKICTTMMEYYYVWLRTT